MKISVATNERGDSRDIRKRHGRSCTRTHTGCRRRRAAPRGSASDTRPQWRSRAAATTTAYATGASRGRQGRPPPRYVAALRTQEPAEDAADAGDASVEQHEHRDPKADHRTAQGRRSRRERGPVERHRIFHCGLRFSLNARDPSAPSSVSATSWSSASHRRTATGGRRRSGDRGEWRPAWRAASPRTPSPPSPRPRP